VRLHTKLMHRVLAHTGFVTNIPCRRCRNEELVHSRKMAYCMHSRAVLSLSNENTQYEMKLVRLRMRDLTPTYDVVVAVMLSSLPSRVG
jgi:hypothetical protein